MTDQNDHNDKGRGPIDQVHDGAVRAKIWRNEGENGVFFSTTLSRLYTDSEGEVQETNSFAGTDLLKASEAAREAYHREKALKRAEFKEQRRAEQTSTRARSTDRQNDR